MRSNIKEVKDWMKPTVYQFREDCEVLKVFHNASEAGSGRFETISIGDQIDCA
jgi:hypothetical protein